MTRKGFTCFPSCVLLLTRAGGSALCRRANANLSRFAAKGRTVVYGVAVLVLPLMHHLVQKRVKGLLPSMPAEMAPADGDLARLRAVSGCIVTQTAPHATRNANRHGSKDAGEMLGVEARVTVSQAHGKPLILRACPQPTDWLVGNVDWIIDNAATGSATGSAGAALDEGHDGFVHLRRRGEETLMNAKLSSTKAHHHVAIAGEPAAGDRRQPELTKAPEELVGGVDARRYLEWKRQLRWIMATEEAGQRLKHFARPGANVRASGDQRSVDTSISSGVMRMLLTDDGRPPRERFEMVPAVEMIVPFFVCSM